MNKRGQVGLDIVQKVFLVLLVLAVLAFSLIITLSSLGDSGVAKTSSGTFSVQNETLVTVPETGESLSVVGLGDVNCDILHIINATSADTIPSSNFTETRCTIAFTSGNSLGFNNSDWNVTYTYTYNLFTDPQQNVTAATGEFFANATTWLTLLSVVVIILIISIVLIAVRGFADRKGGL